MSELSQMHIVSDKNAVQALPAEDINRYRKDLPDWELVEEEGEPRLKRVFRFKNFAQALDFTNRVGAIAEQYNHHPALLTEWGKVTVSWWTHTIRGLHQNDFVMAAKTDALYGA